MADTGERDVMDRLAEALWRVTFSHDVSAQRQARWDAVEDKWKRTVWHPSADTLLSALPAVGLRIGRVEE